MRRLRPAVPCDRADATLCPPVTEPGRWGGGGGGALELRDERTELLAEFIGLGSAALYADRPADSDDMELSPSCLLPIVNLVQLVLHCHNK